MMIYDASKMLALIVARRLGGCYIVSIAELTSKKARQGFCHSSTDDGK